MIQGVIFDLDGVLVSTDEYHYLGWKHIAEKESIYFDKAINLRQRGVSRMESLDILLEKASRTYSSQEKQSLAREKNEQYQQLLHRLTSGDILPGVLPTLKALQQAGIKLAVGSSSKNTPQILKYTGLCDYFDAVADGNDITHSKPDPEVFLLAAHRLHLPPASCLVVEDALAGIEAAQRANMAYLGIGEEKTLPDVQPRVANLAEFDIRNLL